MSLVINHNMMSANVARNLNSHYANLSKSTMRLSSGMRVNSAADDAAGLAIRELQRADIAALQQGARNANDAISLIQVADGSLGVIDEKLIRMKELAEQAATGSYDSTQRQMIDSEYQAMAREITRIGKATDFNGIHLLDGTLECDVHDGSGLTSTGKMKIHFGTGNDAAEDYYYIQINECTAESLGLGNESTWEDVCNRCVTTFSQSLDKYMVPLLGTTSIDSTVRSAIQTASKNWVNEFSTALESYIPPTAALATTFASYSEVSDLGTFPTDFSSLTLAEQQKWEYAIGHAALNTMDFCTAFTVPTVSNFSINIANGGIITVNDTAHNVTISGSVSNTVTDAHGNTITYNENGTISSVQLDASGSAGGVSRTFTFNTDGTFTTTDSGNTITFDAEGYGTTLVDSANNTLVLTPRQGESDPFTKVDSITNADGTMYTVDLYDTTAALPTQLTDDSGNVYVFGVAGTVYDNATATSNTVTFDGLTYNFTYTDPNGISSFDGSIDSIEFPSASTWGAGTATSIDVSSGTVTLANFTGRYYSTAPAGTVTLTDVVSTSYMTDGTNRYLFDEDGNVTDIFTADSYHISIASSDGSAPYTYIFSDQLGNSETYTFNGTTLTNTGNVDVTGAAYTPALYDAAVPLYDALEAADRAEIAYRALKVASALEDAVAAKYAINTDINASLPGLDANGMKRDAIAAATLKTDATDSVALYHGLRSTLCAAAEDAIAKGNQYSTAGFSITTQEDAQLALEAINNAIVQKDQIRANLGALQNRFENTITNLNTMAENLQAAESRISDVDVATEMTEFVRQQILSQAAVAMLAQANSLPQMAMQLIGG